MHTIVWHALAHINAKLGQIREVKVIISQMSQLAKCSEKGLEVPRIDQRPLIGAEGPKTALCMS